MARNSSNHDVAGCHAFMNQRPLFARPGHYETGRRLSRILLLASLVALAGCAALTGRSTEAPAVDLYAPGWRVWTGQGSWVRERDQPAMAGDLLVAKNTNGDVFVSFTKAALPLFTARATGAGWWIDFVERDRSYSGAGSPPGRFIWFSMPQVLQQTGDIANWSVSWVHDDEVILQNPRTGERIQMLVDL